MKKLINLSSNRIRNIALHVELKLHLKRNLLSSKPAHFGFPKTFSPIILLFLLNLPLS
jgi:hypothetical protein